MGDFVTFELTESASKLSPVISVAESLLLGFSTSHQAVTATCALSRLPKSHRDGEANYCECSMHIQLKKRERAQKRKRQGGDGGDDEDGAAAEPEQFVIPSKVSKCDMISFRRVTSALSSERGTEVVCRRNHVTRVDRKFLLGTYVPIRNIHVVTCSSQGERLYVVRNQLHSLVW